MTEEWRQIADLPGYEVSNEGRVRSVDRVIVDSLGRRQFWPSMIRKLAPMGDYGHLYVTMRRDGKLHLRRVHRLVLEAFVGPCPEGMVCCHNNGDASDNRVGNLRWDTLSANLFDCVAHGTHAFASRTHCKRGHEFSDSNTRIVNWPDGRFRQRYCRACVRDRRAARNQAAAS